MLTGMAAADLCSARTTDRNTWHFGKEPTLTVRLPITLATTHFQQEAANQQVSFHRKHMRIKTFTKLVHLRYPKLHFLYEQNCIFK